MTVRPDGGGRRSSWPSARLLVVLVGLGGALGLAVASRSPAAAADPATVLTGTYSASSQKGTLTLLLVVDDSGRLVGLLRSDSGGEMRLDGRASGPSAEGTITDGRTRSVFALHLDGARLGLAMAEMDRDGHVDPSRALRVTLVRVETGAAGAPVPPGSSGPSAQGAGPAPSGEVGQSAAPTESAGSDDADQGDGAAEGPPPGPAGASPGTVGPLGTPPAASAPPGMAVLPRPGPGPGAPAGVATQPQSGGLSPAAREWDQRLRGQRLTQLSGYSSGGGGGGYTSERRLYLCSNGTFVYSGQSSVSMYVPGASGGSAGRSGDAGTWRIVSEGNVVRIELQSQSGGIARYVLSRGADGKTFLGRTRTFVTPDNDRCP